MPLYEYQCEKCGERFEVMQKFADEALSTHEKCGGKVHRLLSAPALQFKGSGWYITDYAKGQSGDNGASNKADAPAGTSSSATEPGAASPPASGTESKSATKPETKSTKSDTN